MPPKNNNGWRALSWVGEPCRMVDSDPLKPVVGSCTFSHYDPSGSLELELLCSFNSDSFVCETDKIDIYVNNYTTILKRNGKTYTSRPEKGEKFDLEKGIMVCLLKSCGFSTSDILKLVKNAKIQPNKKKKGLKSNKK